MLFKSYCYNGWSGINMKLEGNSGSEAQDIQAIKIDIHTSGMIEGNFLLYEDFKLHGFGNPARIRFKVANEEGKVAIASIIHVYDFEAMSPDDEYLKNKRFTFKGDGWEGWEQLTDANSLR